MNGLGRSYTILKSNSTRSNGKSKDGASSSRHKSETSLECETTTPYVIPLIRQAESVSVLPKFTNVLSRTSEDGVTMEDLDPLQQDFEKLLSSCALRNRFLRGEIESIDKVEEKRDKKGKLYDKGSLKRKRPNDKLKHKDVKNGTRIIKKQYGLTVNNYIGEIPLRHGIPKVTLPKNDISEKFWASVEPYCAEIQKEDVAFLDNLIQECSKEINIKIPEIGEHYAQEWSDEIIADEQNITRSPKSKSTTQDFKKNGINLILDTFTNPKTQSLLSALIEERVMSTFPSGVEKLKASDVNVLKSFSGNRGGICMERRLKKELVEQGILSVEDIHKIVPDDEILSEIKKCQQELGTVNEYNIEELNKLRTIVAKEMRRQEIKEALDKVDNQVFELYNKVLQAKQKVHQTDDEELDKSLLNKQITKDFESQADLLLKQQLILNRELTELADLATFY